VTGQTTALLGKDGMQTSAACMFYSRIARESNAVESAIDRQLFYLAFIFTRWFGAAKAQKKISGFHTRAVERTSSTSESAED